MTTKKHTFKLYTINEDYINYLRKSDPKVLENKSEKRPYLGIILKQDNFDYFSPLTSPKEKHKKMKNRYDFIKIDKGSLGIINLNNSIPVNYNEIKLLDITNLKNSSDIMDKKYGIMCENQLIWCNKNFEIIQKNFKKLYSFYLDNRLPENIKKRCCDFKLLEKKSLDYENNKQSIYISLANNNLKSLNIKSDDLDLER